MRLRPLTEAECYARCYGNEHDDSVRVLRPEADRTASQEGADRVDGSGEQPRNREAA